MRQMRVLMRQRQEIADDRAALGAVVADNDRGGAGVQLLDRSQPHQAERLAADDYGKRQPRGGGKAEADITKALAAREEILDQLDDAEPGAEQHEATGRHPEQRAPAEAAPH